MNRFLLSDAGGLPDCISQGKSKLKNIISAVNQVDDKVRVNVFADSSFLETRMSELTLQCNMKVSGKTAMINWKDFIKKERKDYEPVITVIVLPSQEEKVRLVDRKHSQHVQSPLSDA